MFLISTETDRSLWNGLRFWGFWLALTGAARAVSYALFPPPPGSATAEFVFTIMPPTSWVIAITIEAVLITIGAIFKKVIPLFAGCSLGMLFYLVFAYNLGVAAVRQQSGWSGVIPLVVIAVLNAYVVWILGPRIRNKLDGNKDGG